MKRLLEHRDAWGCPAAVWILALAAFATPLIGYGLTYIRLENSVENWLPANDPLSQTYAWYCRHFGNEDKIILSWKSSQIDDPRMERLALALRGEIDEFGIRRNGSKYFSNVMTPKDAIDQITQHKIPRDEAVRRLTGLLVGPDDGPAGMVLTLNESGQADNSGAVEELREFAVSAGIPSDEIAMGGSAVGGSALNTEMKKAAWNPSVPIWQFHKRSPVLLSFVVSTLLAIVLLRTPRMTLYVLGPTLLATLAAIAVVPAVGSDMNMVLVVMPTLLMVLTLSAAIHIINYYRHSVYQCVDDPAVSAVKTAWWPCILANITTSLGLISLVGSPLSPVRDFGFFSAIGCLIALPIALYVLPSLLQLWPVPVAPCSTANRGVWGAVGKVLVRWRYVVIIGSLVCVGFGAYGLQYFRTETKAIRYFPPEARVVQDYHFLEEELSGIVPIETVVVFDAEARQKTSFLDRMELVREITDSIREHPEISGALSLAEFQPVSARPATTASFTTKASYYRRSSIVEDRVKTQDASKAFFAICQAAPPDVASVTHVNAVPGDELWRVTAHAAIMSNADYSNIAGEIESRVRAVVGKEVTVPCVVTGTIPLILRTQQAVVDSLVLSFGSAFVMIAAVMCFLLRGVRAGMIVMLPNLVPVFAVFGAISWYGIAVDIGTMITASVALGIAVDGTLHLSETFKHHISTNHSRHMAAILAISDCGPALCQTSLVVGGGLAMLAWGDLLLVSRFGWLMAALVGVACLADVILLPALLADPLGYVLEKSMQSPSPSKRRLTIPKPHAWKDLGVNTSNNDSAVPSEH